MRQRLSKHVKVSDTVHVLHTCTCMYKYIHENIEEPQLPMLQTASKA